MKSQPRSPAAPPRVHALVLEFDSGPPLLVQMVGLRDNPTGLIRLASALIAAAAPLLALALVSVAAIGVPEFAGPLVLLGGAMLLIELVTPAGSGSPALWQRIGKRLERLPEDDMERRLLGELTERPDRDRLIVEVSGLTGALLRTFWVGLFGFVSPIVIVIAFAAPGLTALMAISPAAVGWAAIGYAVVGFVAAFHFAGRLQRAAISGLEEYSAARLIGTMELVRQHLSRTSNALQTMSGVE